MILERCKVMLIRYISSKELSNEYPHFNEYLIAKIGVDTDENEPPNAFRKWASQIEARMVICFTSMYTYAFEKFVEFCLLKAYSNER